MYVFHNYKSNFLYISVGSCVGCVRFCVCFMVIFYTFLSTKYELINLSIMLDFTKMPMISRKIIGFHKNAYDFTKIDRISRKCIWFHENAYDFTNFRMTSRKLCFYWILISNLGYYWIYNFFSVFLIHMCIFFSEMTEI